MTARKLLPLASLVVAIGAGSASVAAPDAPPMPAGGAQAPGAASEDPRDREIRELRRLVEELRRRIEELEKRSAPTEPGAPRPAPPAPPPPEPTPPQPETPPAPQARPAATYLPNISLIGNLIARGGDTRAIPGRGRSHFEELEIAFQDAVAPKLRYDVFLNAEKEEEWRVGMEEGFLTASAILRGLSLRAGRIRTPIGKFNRLHPHQWPFITQPAAHTALLGEHGLISDGLVAEYLFPSRRHFAQLELGAWQTTGTHEHEDEAEEHPAGFRGGDRGAYSARFWFGKEVGRDRELEIGLSRYWGRGEVPDVGRRMQAINLLDLTYRHYPAAYRRLFLQAELLAHETRGIGGDTKLRPGAFLTGAYRWSRYWEAGLRGDYTRFPYPLDGKQYGVSLFLTRFLTEQTSLRLEYQGARVPGFGWGNGLFLQLLFGSGPHTHALQ